MLKNLEKVLFFLTLLFLPTQLGRHFWPQFSFVYSLPIDYLSPVLYFWDILVIFLFVVFLFQKRSFNKTALNLFYFFILTQVLSLLLTVNTGAGFVRLEQYLIAGIFGVFIASFEKSEIKNVYLPLTVAVLGEAFLSILQFLKSETIGLWILGERSFTISTPGIAKFDFYGREFLRPYGTFPHPNVLAGFLLISLLILPKKSYLTILAGITLLLTVSRVVLIGAFVSAIFIFNSQGKKILILIFVLLLPILYTRYFSLFNFDSLTLLRREELVVTAIKLWTKNPLLGVGLNNFIPNGADLLLSGPSRFLQPVHNIFLLTLSETGIVGLIGLIVLIGYPIFVLIKLYPKPFTLTPMLLIWSVIIFLGMFDHYFLTLPQGYRLLFLVWGLSLSTFNKQREG